MTTSFTSLLSDVRPHADFWSYRFVNEEFDYLSVRQNVLQPVKHTQSRGCMVTVMHQGGYGYAATSDLSKEGLARAFEQAMMWAKASQNKLVFDPSQVTMPKNQDTYKTKVIKPWEQRHFKETIDGLEAISKSLPRDSRIVDWSADLARGTLAQTYISSNGSNIEQAHDFLYPNIHVTANEGSNTQTRSLGGRGYCKQQGLELLEKLNFSNIGNQIVDEAIQLLLAPNCPQGIMTLVLDPDQMMLQIHESIGHPLELDRILGDERNYAGTSFVTPDMFGNYQYGSNLLNISFDPTISDELASFGYDDDGLKAEKIFVIRNGILQRPLGGSLSQVRAGMQGVANARACSWNRPPIDRMANLNLEPGTSTFDDIIKSTEHGIYMKTNISWSIDDSRNKFQFGCEWAQLIENGKLTTVVRNPNYRGISANFWRNLSMVGDMNTFDVLGTPNCGKGEPNQVVRVGHASPICKFDNIEVFGGI